MEGTSMELGFKIDSFVSRHGRRPGVADWDRASLARELGYWRTQGMSVVELTADLHSQTGAFYQYTPAEWRDVLAVVNDAGLRYHSILAWRRMICREPWVEEKLQDLQRIAEVSEVLGLKIIDVLVAYPNTGPSGGAATRPRFRSLWDATEQDFLLSAERLKRYARQIASFGASLSLEIHEDTLHDCAPSAIRLLRLIDEPNVGLNPDTLDNGWLFPGETLPDGITQAHQVLPYVNHWHVKQFERTLVDGVWQIRSSHADEGTQPVATIARLLANAGYRGAAIHECGRGHDHAYSLKRFRDYFRWLLDEYVPAVSAPTAPG
jgi:sugar phosphate isomerase/epimerase